jgi:hypothetical protein
MGTFDEPQQYSAPAGENSDFVLALISKPLMDSAETLD